MCIRDRPEPWIPLPANGSQNHHHIPPAAGERETCTHATASTTGGPHTPRSAGPFPSPKYFLCPLCPITEPAGGPIFCHAAVPLTFRIKVRHRAHEPPSSSSRLGRGCDTAPRGAGRVGRAARFLRKTGPFPRGPPPNRTCTFPRIRLSSDLPRGRVAAPFTQDTRHRFGNSHYAYLPAFECPIT